ncbi:ABC transporter substrate-binding protein [Ensifer sp. T173]|jgi:peptide/nickel transport system substrate-binding protein|uniref:ABC transporter substrate-binding protein n=1 Tax=Ensifer canadensis TaxID=555315 RepID=A0AAW4FHI0_9HYPH|nr:MULTISPECIES: ABC transporter substrate-binding protein [Ensifer]AHK45172.1 ABC transporter, periplasmic oligopeptide-binding protein [Ensifer adhaerens OV14]MDP9630102.1 peptide/nickel transport system substrate-binding protein [Ensifer adhaerens]KQW83441.1 ABC transporter substrate-binding protein [Ensifer sp. Root127]KQY65925.1 ABC transporter substrate-binding protein [Ensifer sp. Root142]MBD9492065.1 ABC transporter substrate-binding protein [Ensifer sp. ENS11]
MMHKLNGRLRLLTASAALAMVMAATAPAFAETPKDTLVEAFAIDDVISMDPGEAFELTAAEITGNTYSMLVRLDINDTTKIVGDLADSWTVSDDGLTYTFKLKSGLKFASGNPVTAADVAWSFERAVKLDKSPAFILTQFGLTGDNVTEKAKAVDDTTFVFTVDQPYAPSFVLNCLTATVGAVLDKKLVLENVKPVTPTDDYKYDNDFGNEWLKTGYAGSGPFKLREWRANEVIVLERNDNYYGEQAKLARVIYRHMKESSGQRLALEAGDIDIARNLEPGDFDAVAKNADLGTTNAPKGTVYYISLNQKNANLAKPEVREAFKYLVDYDAIGSTIIKGIGEIHQSFLPKGVLGALDENPYKFDVAKAKELLAKAGLADGFTVTMDVRNGQPVTGIAESFQQTLGQAGVKLEIIPGDGKQTLTKYRARNHDMYIGQWGMDYFDPNSNAETFTSNPDNSDEGKNKTLAWRNAWDVPELTKKTKDALLERDSAKRAETYKELQKTVLGESPFVIIFQQTEVAGYRGNVKGLKLGPSFDTNFVAGISKE